MIAVTLLLACASPVATDGDSIRCADGVKLRLAGIEAPDTPSYCKRTGRVCTLQEWRDSKASLRAAIKDRDVTYRYVATDKYKRTVAVVYAGGQDLSCLQIAAGQAYYVHKWNGNKIACGDKKTK